MINRTLMLVAAGVVLILAGGLYFSSQFTKQDAQERSMVYGVVTDFGQHFKDVALLSPHVKEEINAAYKAYVTPDLLQAWEDDPASAPGRITSTPWPDHFNINMVVKHGKNYEVDADVVLVTSAEAAHDGEVGTMSSHMVLSPQADGTWLVSRYQSP